MPTKRHTETDYRETWPKYLQEAGRQAPADLSAERPVLIPMHQADAAKRLEQVVSQNTIWEINDNYDEQLAELFISENAHLYRAESSVKAHSIADHLRAHYAGRPPWQMGTWVYYPWSGQLVHVLAEDLLWRLRTIRNRNLITSDEQKQFSDFKVGCLGLSVGSAGALTLAMSGGSRCIKLADGGVMSGSNLNRMLTPVDSVGQVKSLVIARQMYELDPYLEIHRLPTNTTAENLPQFFEQPWPLDVVIDEVDDLEIKIRARLLAREHKLPVLMVSDLGDQIMIDVERFDQDQSLPLFHGLAGEIEHILEKKNMTQREWQRHATSILGLRNLPLRLQQSVIKIGTEIPTHPQLGGTVMIGGAALSFAVRQLATGGPLKSGRHFITLDSLLEGHGSLGHRRAHRKHSKALEQALKAMQ